MSLEQVGCKQAGTWGGAREGCISILITTSNHLLRIGWWRTASPKRSAAVSLTNLSMARFGQLTGVSDAEHARAEQLQAVPEAGLAYPLRGLDYPRGRAEANGSAIRRGSTAGGYMCAADPI